MISYLITDPKVRKVIVCEPTLFPIKVKQVLSELLFKHFQCQSVTFLPSPVLALMSVGKQTGLVVEIASDQITITPVRVVKHTLNPSDSH